MASRRSRVRIPPAPPVESKKLTLENRLLLPATVAISAVPRAFKQESFTLGEENGYGPLHLIACINAGDGQFRPSIYSFRRIIVRFRSKENPLECARVVEARARVH